MKGKPKKIGMLLIRGIRDIIQRVPNFGEREDETTKKTIKGSK